MAEEPDPEKPATIRQYANAEGSGTHASNNLSYNGGFHSWWWFVALLAFDIAALLIAMFWSTPAKGY